MGARSMADTPSWNRLGTAEDYTFIIGNTTDLVNPSSNSNDLTIYDSWVVVE
jgi:hypothetical protein